MSDPFRFDGPAVISFSGGRTSAYMLRRVLDANGGVLPPDTHVIFANTGKEREETLRFIHECETRWNVPVVWAEYRPLTMEQDHHPSQFSIDVVSYETASRNGEPFDRLIQKMGMLPNVTMRHCTNYLKGRVIDGYARRVLGFESWLAVIGIRADEPRRVSRMRAQSERERGERHLPLADVGVTEADVLGYWAQQPFDLGLRRDQGNCDLCFLKSFPKILNLVREEPARAVWWANWEETLQRSFRLDRPGYAHMMAQQDLFADLDDDLIECACTD